MIAPLIVGGIGTGFFVAPLQTAILSDTMPENVGSASGCVPTVQQIGASIGLAVVTLFFFGQVSAQAGSAVPAARADLATDLQTTSVEPMFRTAVADRFADCARAQLTSPHPEQPAKGCDTATSATSAPSGLAATLAAQAHDELRAAGRSVAARTFVGAFQATVWSLAAISLVIAALSLALGRQRDDPAPP
ncbi:hypothetical protein D7316_00623 [Gordonia insulae]|uniref:Uncharacterized protein n=1 Tax=Gordonia insulae TaxID=2420509 RepID=A0A3G8JGA6_9ACTN|nr:hypothetical protein D7316_00623 [Gordonia insulae]